MSKTSIELDKMRTAISEVISSGGEFRLFPRGTSMLPLLREETDSVVLVSPEDIKKGDILLYRRDNGQFVLHRVVKISGGEYFMCGDNQFSVEHGVRTENILAKTAYFYRGSDKISLSDPAYKKYVKSLKKRRIKNRIRNILSSLKRKIKK